MLLRLLESDMGRPLSDFTPRFRGQDVLVDAKAVLGSDEPVERQVQSTDGSGWFILRVLPYRTVTDEVAGVVLTFQDISRLKETEERLREALAEAKAGRQTLEALMDTCPRASPSPTRRT